MKAQRIKYICKQFYLLELWNTQRIVITANFNNPVRGKSIESRLMVNGDGVFPF